MKSIVILYVEDDPTDILLLRTGMKMRGLDFKIETAGDGFECVAMLRHGFRPDFLLLDLNLPKKNGFEVLKEIKNDPQLSEIPVIVYSGCSNPKVAELCLQMGADEYLEKPSDLAGVMRVIDRLEVILHLV